MEKQFLSRRLGVMEAEGIAFKTGINVGIDVSAGELRASHDAMLLAGGAGWPRDLRVPGRELGGIHFRYGVSDSAESHLRRRRRLSRRAHLGGG